MIGPFAEAVRATTQPCSLLLVLPPLVAVLITRGRWAPFVAVLIGAIVGGWLFAANRVSLDGWSLRLSGILVMSALLLLVAADRTPRLAWAADTRAQSVTAGVIAFVATLWWRPCVGRELGQILTGAQDGIAGQLVPMAAYMLGAMLPVTLAVLIVRAIALPDRSERWVTGAALAAGTITALAMAAGHHDQLVTTLTRWSTS